MNESIMEFGVKVPNQSPLVSFSHSTAWVSLESEDLLFSGSLFRLLSIKTEAASPCLLLMVGTESKPVPDDRYKPGSIRLESYLGCKLFRTCVHTSLLLYVLPRTPYWLHMELLQKFFLGCVLTHSNLIKCIIYLADRRKHRPNQDQR